MRFINHNKLSIRKSSGFTLIEMLIIAPVVILVIGGFVALMVSMVGDVLITRDRNTMTYTLQDALNNIEQDTRLSTEFRTTTGTLPTPQGLNDGTGAFTSSSSLILTSLTSDKNPVDSNRQIIYYASQPNPCGSTQSANRMFLSKTVYYLKNGSLWRRVILPTYNTLATPDENTVCNTPWQRNTCSPGYSAGVCQTNDTEVMKNVDSFNVKYYSDPTSNTDLGTSGAKDASTIEVTINGKKTTAGEPVSSSGTIRATKLNDVSADLPPPASPTVNYTLTAPASAKFTWNKVPNTNSYQISYNINGGTATNVTVSSSTTSYTVDASRTDTITFRVAAKNATGLSPDGVSVATMPSWTDLDLSNGWIPYDTNTYNSAGFTRTKAGVVILKGLIKGGNSLGYITVGTLPPGYRPTSHLIFQTSSALSAAPYSGMSRIDIYPNGDIQIAEGTNGWVSFDGISFLPEGSGYTWSNFSYSPNWSTFDANHPPVQAAKDSNSMIHLQGLTKQGATAPTMGSLMATAPAGFAPGGYMLFPAKSDTGVYNLMQINGTTGNVESRAISGSFISTQAMYYPSTYSSWNNLTLQNPWVNYGGAWATAQYTKSPDGLVTVKGLIRFGATTNGTVVGNLPAGYRPSKRLLFDVPANQKYGRMDVLPNGNIVIQDVGDNAFEDLSAISFIAEQ